ncbi:putative metal-dependent protease of the PAD1/JAB1 superfamily [Actinobacteria bacterium IMCC26207]|nr:putative metal-dependent protease of the PAD1/JAB1 superfamily [Actinobacteria bacterium IMCC26207]
MIAHALDGMPLEACGLFAGIPATAAAPVPASAADAATAAQSAEGQISAESQVFRFYPCENEAQSSKLYTVPGKAFLQADRDAEANGWQILGVMHSHTHTDAYPSPTDVAQAPDPDWHYVIVSLRDDLPSLRSYRIVDGTITEEQVRLAP